MRSVCPSVGEKPLGIQPLPAAMQVVHHTVPKTNCE